MKKQSTPREGDLPKISAPAQRALAAAGVQTLKDLTRFREQEVGRWHGIGPNVLAKLRLALKDRGWSFKS